MRNRQLLDTPRTLKTLSEFVKVASLKKHLENNGIWVEGLCWPSFSQKAGEVSDIDYHPSDGSLVIYVHEQYGRFGNNIIQVLHALIVAHYLKIKQVFCSFYIDGENTRSVIIEDISINFGCLEAPKAPCVSATMFYLQGFEDIVNNIDFDRLKYYAERLSRSLIPVRNTQRYHRSAERIAFHFRSGDIFSTNRNPIYTQPPLAYYVMALDHICSTMTDYEIFLVYEDDLNPCIKQFIKVLKSRNIKFHEQSAGFNDDAALMATADCIVASYSSFCDVLALMNENLKRWYSFRSIGAYEGIELSLSKSFADILQVDGTQVYIVEDVKGSYIPLGKWTFSEEQKIELIEYPASHLKLRKVKTRDSVSIDSDQIPMAIA